VCSSDLPMPLQFMLTSDATSRIYRYAGREDSRANELLGTPVGQIIGSMTAVRSVRDVIFNMVEDFAAATDRITSINS